MAIALLSIGTELLRGEIDDTNASWLCREVVALGREVSTRETVGDDPAAIAATLSRLGAANDVIVCTGGLGPTTDDVTSLAAARALGVELVRDEQSLGRLRARYDKRGVAFAESNAKQADFPAGAAVLPNDWGTAPGFCVRLGRAVVFFLPGVPREMQPMFARYVVPELERSGHGHTAQIRIRTYGAPESKVNDLLAGVERDFGVSIGYRAHFPEIDVKPMTTRASGEEAERAVADAAAEIRQRLGELVYGEGDRGLPEVVIELLRERGLSFGLAESCTGGLVASLLTAHSCSDVFVGGVVSYSNDVKVGVLGVSREMLQSVGAVSQPAVEQMASQARRVLGCDICLAVSGIAGPGGGSAEKPVGLVHFALAIESGTTATEQVLHGDRERVQRGAAYYGLNLVRKALKRIAT